MVNVNKNIVPGKLAESSAKTEPQAPARRPRNQELNSSKKTVSVTHGETHSTEQNPFKAKLNCSRKLNCSVTGNITSDVYDKLYTREDDPQKVADVLGCTVADVTEIDSETEDLGYGKTVGYLLAKPEYEEELSQNGIEILSILEDGTVGMMVGRGFHTVETDLELVLDHIGENLDSSAEGNAEGEGDQSLNSSEGEGDEGFAEEPAGDADGGESVGEGADLADIKITTESGNEVSMQDIKIVQNPDTNELALFIPEDEEETIPEGFTVIGMVVPDTLDSATAIEGGDVCPECGQDPCVCENTDGEELDSSKKKNPKVESVGNGLYMYHGYTIEQSESGNSFLIEDNGEYYDFDSIDDAVEFIDDTEKQRYGSDYDEYVTQFDSSRKKNELTSESVNSSLGGGDDRQDATSQVTVPKSFPDDKVHDLYRWVESELQNEGIDVDVYGVGRPSASTISFEFEVTGRDPSEVDAIIEDRVKEFIANGNNAIQYPEGDPRSELNSGKHEKSLNCKVENARVEPTEQGTWVVKADTDRFGKNAILYEHYSEEGANKYLDRLKAGGEAVANGYDGHIDLKKVDLDSGDGTAEAKLDKASISKAMAKVLLEDKDTPLVYVKLKDGIQAYIQPAGYEDNQLVADGNFDDANIYVAMYDADYKPVMVNGKVDNKMKGSEIVDYIRRNLGM